MKRLWKTLLLCLCLAALLALSAAGASADLVECGICGGEGDGKALTWSLESDGVLTVSGSGPMADYGFFFDPPPWASLRAEVLNCVLLPGVTSIGDNAFSGCEYMTELSIPEGVTVLGDGAFSDCAGLTAVSIPEGVTVLGDSVFFYCDRLSELSIPDSVTEIKAQAFYACASLSSVSIPGDVESIGFRTFYNCAGLSEVSIPAGVRDVGDEAFSGCVSLSDVYYGGDEAAWEAISFGQGNDALLEARIHFDSAPKGAPARGSRGAIPPGWQLILGLCRALLGLFFGAID